MLQIFHFLVSLSFRTSNLPLVPPLYGNCIYNFPYRPPSSGRFRTWSIRSKIKNVFLFQIFNFLVLVHFRTRNLPLVPPLYGNSIYNFPYRPPSSGRFETWSIGSNKKMFSCSRFFSYLVLVSFRTGNLDSSVFYFSTFRNK